MDSRRNFSSAEKNSIAIIQGVDAGGMEADHIVPFSKGGDTDVSNCQLISPEANRAKGNRFMNLRAWQKKFLSAWDGRDSGTPFLLVAIPGGGKTFAALKAAHEWLMAGNDRRVIVVVPTDNLRNQWQKEALTNFGLQLQTKEFGVNFKSGFTGAVTTYATVSSQTMLLKALCSRCPTMVIFDEIHHCGDNATYGIAVKEAFSNAKEKLLLSGTPWRTCGTMIPFVTYDGNGMSVSHYSYDYPSALNENVVRWLVFHYDSGELHFPVDGRIEQFNLDITEEEASQRLGKLLQPDGEFVSGQIVKAHARLMEIRKTVPDAAAMAACKDQWHAQAVAKTIERLTGCVPHVVVSDDDISTGTVDSFRNARSEWIVSVRQVSEGTDIKRLQVLCYFTNWVTSIFFRQLIGRVSRFRDIDDFEGYVFLPSDPRLKQLATTIMEAQQSAARSPIEREKGDTTSNKADAISPAAEPFSTRHTGSELVLICNKEYPKDIADKILDIHHKEGLPLSHVAKVFDYIAAAPVVSVVNKVKEPETLESEIDRLRKQINTAAVRLAKASGIEIKEVHMRFNKPQSQMSLQELRAKLSKILEWHRSKFN